MNKVAEWLSGGVSLPITGSWRLLVLQARREPRSRASGLPSVAGHMKLVGQPSELGNRMEGSAYDLHLPS